MIRTLALIAAAGFVLCIGSLAGALALAGGAAGLKDRVTQFAKEADIHIASDDNEIFLGDQGPSTTRQMPWNGADTLEIDAFAEVNYIQGPAGRISLEGPAAVLDKVSVRNGKIEFDGHRWKGGALKVTVEAPAVRRFELDGVQDLKISGYDQDTLEIDLGGAGRVTAAGKTRRVVLDISGTGAADLTALEVEEAEVDLSGAGKATLGPKSSARIDVSGIGEIELTRRPARLEQNISGAGRVSQPGLPG
ncbi:DUF2807 domain-containing protein [Phenylobacterium sp.]|uniref:GIN domain-containing protein n=1 Tax=Phenylobacterium sp. TaxID=1871053 RepID=UPI0025EE5587|nr:DUF2807 domain-containing protein [Phenylobacterium sp.]MCA3740847.1 DUF2807 domain-containing protein [Phenylobacterium sp.]